MTAGSGASNNIYAWANLLQDDLVAAYGAYFTQTNDGVGGAQVTTFLGSGYISAIPAETALVTIELGINDAYYEVGASTFGSNLETLIDQIRAVTDASILVIGSYKIDSLTDGEWNPYLAAMASAATAKMTAYLDISVPFAGDGYLADGVHPNDAGHALFEDLVYAVLT